MKPLILVIGGAGYIGSHMVRMLLESQYQPVVFDNLSTGHRGLLAEDAIFIPGDLRNPGDVARIFREFRFIGVMHFAASSIVPESVREPLKYYQNNVAAFLNLLEQMKARQVDKLIFSSTAAVYGEPSQTPLTEDSLLRPTNPYGRSKRMMEQILEDASSSFPISYVALRYFNAAGAQEDSETGECHSPETHLIPNLLASAEGEQKEFTLFGDDYPTPDGTCVRDYIHVRDLCRAHLLALQYLERGGRSEILNLGSERGYSVREVLKAVERITKKTFPIRIAARRLGDPSMLVADSRKAKRTLGWEAEEDLESIIRSAYRWHEVKHEKLKKPERRFEFIADREGHVCIKKY